MKKWFKPIIVFVLGLGVLGIGGLCSGLVPISASGGHWPITEWVLSFAMKRSVHTYSLLVDDPPSLSDPALIRRGAGHFEIGCRHCHGGVDHGSFIGQQSTPRAPFLPPDIHEWSDKELFRIVKHGVKFTGMPAWPSQTRDDEVWSMVAFLKELPKLDAKSYQELVYAGSQLPEKKILMSCAHCHGLDGNGRGEDAFPVIAGQNKEYLKETLLAYKMGKRNSGTMQLASHGLKDKMIDELARHYSLQKKKKVSTQEVFERGRAIAENGIRHKKVAACIGCHGPINGGGTKKPEFPDLRGQSARYMVNQLKLLMQHERGGTPHLRLMKKAVPHLTNEEMQDVSYFYHSLGK